MFEARTVRQRAGLHLLAFVLAPVARALQRLRLGKGLSLLAAVLIAFALIGGIFAAIGTQAADLVADLPGYAATLRAKLGSLSGLGDLLRRAGGRYRTPQHRRRLVLVASLLGPIDIPAPTNPSTSAVATSSTRSSAGA